MGIPELLVWWFPRLARGGISSIVVVPGFVFVWRDVAALSFSLPGVELRDVLDDRALLIAAQVLDEEQQEIH